jgi:hypothetical protein
MLISIVGVNFYRGTMNAYERVEALLLKDRAVLAEKGFTLPGTFVVRNADVEAALRKRLHKHGVPEPISLVPIANVPGLRVYIGSAHAAGDLVRVSVADMDAALKGRTASAPAIARLAALTVAKHAHKLTEA